MNETAARAELYQLVQPSLIPVITTEEMDLLLARVGERDASGLAPLDPGYTATYSLGGVYRAAVAGIELKQAKLAHTAIDFSGDAGTYTGSQLLANLQTLKTNYQRYTAAALQTKAAPGVVQDVRVNWNDPYAESA